MANLNTKLNLAAPDDIYAMLLERHEGKSKAQSDAFNARLILLLMNHIGNTKVLKQALTAAEFAED